MKVTQIYNHPQFFSIEVVWNDLKTCKAHIITIRGRMNNFIESDRNKKRPKIQARGAILTYWKNRKNIMDVDP